jgi:hypothetical protein
LLILPIGQVSLRAMHDAKNCLVHVALVQRPIDPTIRSCACKQQAAVRPASSPSTKPNWGGLLSASEASQFRPGRSSIVSRASQALASRAAFSPFLFLLFISFK